MTADLDGFRDRRVLITGGLGFLGSNLALRLVELGARVTLLDAMVDDHGGNPFNIEPIRSRVAVNFSDIRDEASLKYLVTGQDYVFHLAGQNDHVLSLRDPFPDIDINIKGSAMLLEACRRYNRGARLVYGGTRGEYGPAIMLPVAEDHPMRPRGIYELSSLTAQQLFQIYHDNHGVASVTLRLTNIYGERAQMKHDRFGVANWFVRQALDGETIRLYGDGSQVRDLVYVDDTVEAFLAAGQCAALAGRAFNVGSGEPSSLREIAETLLDVAGGGKVEYVPFPEDARRIEIGDYVADVTLIQETLGWRAKVGLREGLQRSVDFYRKNREHYW